MIVYLFLLGYRPPAPVRPLKARLRLSGRLCRGGLPCAGAAALPADPGRHCNGFPAGAEVSNRLAPWRPLVLLIPLRLGLTDINEAYVETLKVGGGRRLLAHRQGLEMPLVAKALLLWPCWHPVDRWPRSRQS